MKVRRCPIARHPPPAPPPAHAAHHHHSPTSRTPLPIPMRRLHHTSPMSINVHLYPPPQEFIKKRVETTHPKLVGGKLDKAWVDESNSVRAHCCITMRCCLARVAGRSCTPRLSANIHKLRAEPCRAPALLRRLPSPPTATAHHDHAPPLITFLPNRSMPHALQEQLSSFLAGGERLLYVANSGKTSCVLPDKLGKDKMLVFLRTSGDAKEDPAKSTLVVELGGTIRLPSVPSIPCMLHRAPPTTRNSPYNTRRSPCTTHHSPLTTHHSPSLR